MNLYDEYDIIEAQRMRADFTYRSFLSRDTTELDNFNKKIRERQIEEYPQLSKRFKSLTERVVTSKHISTINAKHAFLIFVGFYLNPEIVEELIMGKDGPKTNPIKMKIFYEKYLPKLCTSLLDSTFSCMQEFVERSRTIYFKL
jgi:hypothetical protein